MLELQQLADQRAQAESTIAARAEAEQTAAEQDYEARSNDVHEQYALNRRETENEFARVKLQAAETYDRQLQTGRQNRDQAIQQIDSQFSQRSAEASRKQQEASWQAHAVFDASKDKPKQTLQEAGKRLEHYQQQTRGLERDAQTIMAMRKLQGYLPTRQPPDATDSPGPEATADVTEHAKVSSAPHKSHAGQNSADPLQETIRYVESVFPENFAP
jgi:hypothetical protein